MTDKKCVGIWIDHSHANLTSLAPEESSTTITSEFDHEVKLKALSHGEKSMHNKEHHMQSKYYHKIIAEIKKYTDVLLFGPTDAKLELYNLMKNENGIAHIKVTLKDEDKMTANEEKSMIRKFFENTLTT